MTRWLKTLLTALTAVVLTASTLAPADAFTAHRQGRPIAAAAPAPPATDPYFASVVLLAVNDNQADGTTTFDDQSNSNHTLTAGDTAQYDTAQAPTGMTSSLLTDNAADYVQAAASADFSFDADWTIEVWGRFALRNYVSPYGVGTAFFLFIDSGGNMGYFDGSVRNLGTAVSGSTWTHMAWVRSGTTVTGYKDGTAGTTPVTNAITQGSSTQVMQIGNDGRGGSGNGFIGHLASIRVTKGVARYTSDFTPPTLPLPTS